jgi:hypothetical protein
MLLYRPTVQAAVGHRLFADKQWDCNNPGLSNAKVRAFQPALPQLSF